MSTYAKPLSSVESILLRCYPVWRALCLFMTHRDLQVLCVTSNSMNLLFRHDLEKKQSVNDKLKKFVAEPAEFRRILKQTGAVIAGEFALNYFLGIEPGHFISEGYRKPVAVLQDFNHRIVTFVRADGSRIELVLYDDSMSSEAQIDVLLHAHPVQLACVITAEKAYCPCLWLIRDVSDELCTTYEWRSEAECGDLISRMRLKSWQGTSPAEHIKFDEYLWRVGASYRDEFTRKGETAEQFKNPKWWTVRLPD